MENGYPLMMNMLNVYYYQQKIIIFNLISNYYKHPICYFTKKKSEYIFNNNNHTIEALAVSLNFGPFPSKCMVSLVIFSEQKLKFLYIIFIYVSNYIDNIDITVSDNFI